MTEKLDLFKTLSHMQKGDIHHISKLTEDEIKTLPPFLVMKWLGNSNNANQIVLINEMANRYCFNLYKHPKLLYKLLTSSTISSNERLKWRKRKSKKNTSIANKTISMYYGCSTREASLYKTNLESEDILEMGKELFFDKEEMKKLKKELYEKK